MNNQLLIQEAFRVYDRKMTRIYQELNSLKESYSISEQREMQFIFEGFLSDVANFVKTGIEDKITRTAGKFAKNIMTTGSEAFDKLAKMGKKAVEATKEFYNKVASNISSAFDALKSAPGKFFDTITAISTAVASEAIDVFNSAKEKGSEWLSTARQTVLNIYAKIAEKVSENYDTIKQYYLKNKEAFSSFIKSKKDELQELGKMAQESADSEIKEIGRAIQAILSKGGDIALTAAKYTSLIILGPTFLIGYGTIRLAKKVKESGEEGAELITSSMKVMKEKMGEKWNEVKKDAEEALKILGSIESKFGEEYRKTEGHIIKTFENFLFTLK